MDLRQQSNAENQNSNSKPKRRTRNDQNNRNFTCGCSKSYLSYPALYTHLKQKHGGKPPQGTQLPNNLGSRGTRGRPRIRDDNDNREKNDDDKSQSSNQPEETLEELLLFLDTLGQNYRNTVKFEDETKYLLGSFPLDLLHSQENLDVIFNYMKLILQQKDQAIKEEQEENLPFDPIQMEDIDLNKGIKKTPMNKIFAYFLIEVGTKLSVSAFRETVVFIGCLQRALNEIGYQVISIQNNDQEKKIEKDEKENVKFCDMENGESILLISNQFILQLLPHYFQEMGDKIQKQFTIFGSSDECLKNAVYITQHFSYWLYANKFTNSRLALYTDDE